MQFFFKWKQKVNAVRECSLFGINFDTTIRHYAHTFPIYHSCASDNLLMTQQNDTVSNLYSTNCSGAPSVVWNPHFKLVHLEQNNHFIFQGNNEEPVPISHMFISMLLYKEISSSLFNRLSFTCSCFVYYPTYFVDHRTKTRDRFVPPWFTSAKNFIVPQRQFQTFVSFFQKTTTRRRLGKAIAWGSSPVTTSRGYRSARTTR